MSAPDCDITDRIRVRSQRWVHCSLLLAAAVALVAFRVHAFGLPLETDECNYAYIAGRLLDGGRLYVDVWDHQPPGVFMLVAGVIAAFGDAPIVFRVLACVSSVASMLLIFGIVRRLAGSWPAIGAAFLFAIVSSDPGTAGEGCQREIYMNTLILAAWYLVGLSHRVRAAESKDPLCSNAEAIDDDATGGSEATILQVGRAIRPPPAAHALAPAGTFIAAGFCLGLASLIKTIVAVHWVALAFCVCIPQLRRLAVTVRHTGKKPPPHNQSGRLQRTILALLALSIGPLLIWGGTFGYFALTHRWFDFIDAVFTFNLGYSSDKTLLARCAAFFTPDRHPFIFDSAMPLWIAGATSTAALVLLLVINAIRRRHGIGGHPTNATHRGPGERRSGTLAHARGTGSSDATLPLFVLSLVAASFVAVCLPGHSWPHYYYLMIPPLVICTVCAMGMLMVSVSAPWGRKARDAASVRNETDASIVHSTPLNPPFAKGEALRRRFSLAFATIVFSVVFVSTLYTQYHDYLSQPLFGITAKRLNSRDFWGRSQGENIRGVTDPSDTVFVFANDASIYYYAHRRCASRYTMITGLSDGMPGIDRRRRILMDELRAHPPRVILILFDQQPFDEWKAFLNEFYGEPVGWDLHYRTRKPIMFVMARKDAPIKAIDWDWDRRSVGGWRPGENAR